MKPRYLLPLFCVLLLVMGCQDKKSKLAHPNNFEQHDVLQDTMPEVVNKDSAFISSDATAVPYFPGGLVALRSFIAKQLHYPRAARLMKKEGRVIVSAQVDAQGNLSDLRILMSDDPVFDDEALRLVKMMPRFVTEKHQKAIAGSVEIPVMFRLK